MSFLSNISIIQYTISHVSYILNVKTIIFPVYFPTQTYFKDFAYKTLIEFNTQSMATPESAKTAIHIDAIPQSPNTITDTLTAKAKTTFSYAIFLVFLAML